VFVAGAGVRVVEFGSNAERAGGRHHGQTFPLELRQRIEDTAAMHQRRATGIRATRAAASTWRQSQHSVTVRYAVASTASAPPYGLFPLRLHCAARCER